MLIEAGGEEQLLTADGKNKRIPLHRAAGANPSTSVLQMLLDSGSIAAQLMAKDKEQKLALHWAAGQNTSEVVSALLLHATRTGGSALHNDMLASKDYF